MAELQENKWTDKRKNVSELDSFLNDFSVDHVDKPYYTLYHCHTEDSLLDSCTKYQEYVDLVKESGGNALSISEHGKPLNWTEKWGACKKAGIRYIHSVEMYLTETLDEKIRDNYHTVLMARNEAGLEELNKLISLSCTESHSYYTNRLTFDEFLGISDNIISTSACLASPLNKLPESHPRYMELARKYTFFEIQPHNIGIQKEFNQRLLRLSKELGTPLIAGTDTHSSSKYKSECRDMLLLSKDKAYEDEESLDLSYKTYDELVEAFRLQNAIPEDEWMQAIQNTNLLYDMTEDIELDVSIKYPILYGSREADSEKFTETVYKKLQQKLDDGTIPAYQEQAFRESIEEELRVFRKLQMDGFMLSMSELVSWCKETGKAIGTARGSVGGSRVAYVTDVTDLNPETWHTVFSRFCNEDREEIGDIDIDCVDSDRPAIFEYIVNRFGSNKTARVASFGTMQEKGFIDDIGRALAKLWTKEHGDDAANNPWSLTNVARIKNEFAQDREKTMAKYPKLFYYFDGLVGTKISQSVHPAGMVISPITLDDHFGTFCKDGEICLMLDMENVHDYTGLAKYDFLILKTVQVIKNICDYIGVPYPKTSDIDWDDQEVWADMIKDPSGIFQFEGKFAFESLKRFQPKNIFDMSIVTACIRPSGASYRDDLLARKMHSNPSEIIDELLKDNLGYLIYQEDTIKFLQTICGLSGSEADNIRRAIGRKQKDRLDKAMPSILEGYCNKSQKPRDVAENEAKEFLQIIEDSASYQFGYNHSVAYCLLGYLCAYYRYYYPIEFITSFLNNAANTEDIISGTNYAKKMGYKITIPKWGFSKDEYYFDKDEKVIAKGLSSIKYMSSGIGDRLYEIAHSKKYTYFLDVLRDSLGNGVLDARKLEILIKIDYFSDFGNQRELLTLADLFMDLFKKGEANRISKVRVDGSPIGSIIAKYSNGMTKAGTEAKNYTILDMDSILHEVEDCIYAANMEDLSDLLKVQNFYDVMGYIGYVSGKEEDRPKLYVMDLYPLRRKSDNKQFGYSVIAKSIGSGKESRYTVFNKVYDKNPIQKNNIILCTGYTVEGKYFTLNKYEKLM